MDIVDLLRAHYAKDENECVNHVPIATLRAAADEIERLRHIYQCQVETTEKEIKRRWSLEEENKRLRSGMPEPGPTFREFKQMLHAGIDPFAQKKPDA